MNRHVVKIASGILLLLAIPAGSYYGYKTMQDAEKREQAAALEQGIALFEQKNYPEALAELEKIPPGAADDWRAPYYLGSTQMMLKQYETAAGSLEEALALNPHDGGILYALGVVYYKLGNVPLAKGYFGSVLELNPADKQAKGLYDIMARLEQYSAEAEATDGGEEDTAPDDTGESGS
jgi:Flp pilus assembly protein TadD